jgi:hypothetical protein
VSSGMGMFVGVLLVCVSHMHSSGAAAFDMEEFYMSHAWAAWGVVLCMRHTVLWAAVWLLQLLLCSP